MPSIVPRTVNDPMEKQLVADRKGRLLSFHELAVEFSCFINQSSDIVTPYHKRAPVLDESCHLVTSSAAKGAKRR